MTTPNNEKSVQPFTDKKNYPFLRNIVLPGLDFIIDTWYSMNITFHGEYPKSGPALILPKHQCYLDLILEARILEEATRGDKKYGYGVWANFIMKYFLPRILEDMGGTKVIRQEDRDIILKKDKGLKDKSFADDFNKNVTNYCYWLLEQNQILFIHPESKRYKGAVGPVEEGIALAFSLMRRYYRATKNDLPVYVMGIKYSDSFVNMNIKPLTALLASDFSDDFSDFSYKALPADANSVMLARAEKVNHPHLISPKELAPLVRKYIAELSNLEYFDLKPKK